MTGRKGETYKRSKKSHSPRTEADGHGFASNVDELYDKCVRSHKDTRRSIQRAVIDQSAAETLIWPALIEKQKNASKEDEDSLSFDKTCYLFALLTSWEYQEGGAATALRFVSKDANCEEAWKACCESIFSSRQLTLHCDRKTDQSSIDEYVVWAVQVHFLSVCWAASQVKTKNADDCDDSFDWFLSALLPHVTGLQIWNFMPEHYRELEIRKQPLEIQKQWKALAGEKSAQGENQRPVFIVSVILHFLHLIEGKSLKLNQQQNANKDSGKKKRKRPAKSNTANGDDDEDDGHDDDVDDEENMETSDFDSDSHSDENDEEQAANENTDPIVAEEQREKEENRKSGLIVSLLISEWKFVHRVLELLLDLLSSSTGSIRQYLVPYLLALHWTVRCQQAMGNSTFSNANEHLLLTQQLLERVVRWIHFPVQVVLSNGRQELKSMDSIDLRSLYYKRAATVQKICQRYYSKQLPDVVYAGVGLLCSPSFLRQQAFQVLTDVELSELLHKLRLMDCYQSGPETYNRNFMMAVLEEYLIVPRDILEELQNFPLYPTEQVLWDFSRIPPSHSSLLPSQVLSLPKLQTQFLSFADYLWRNFELVRLESAYEIRSDLTDVVRRLRPVIRQVVNEDQDSSYYDDSAVTKLKTDFTGWSRMAMEMEKSLEIKRVSKPLLGEKYASSVVAEFSIDLAPCGDKIRREWDELGEHDVLFLVAVDANEMSGRPAPLLSDYHQKHGEQQIAGSSNSNRRVPDEDDRTFPSRFGIRLVRGCKIIHVRDEAGSILSDPANSIPPEGTKRIYMVELDPTQFSSDLNSPSGTSMYEGLNLVVRRHGKTNNFRSVLETIRGLMVGMGSISRVIPSWLQAVLLGQTDPKEASYKSKTVQDYAKATVGVPKSDAFLDYGDTFLDEDHLRNSFADEAASIIKVDGREEMSETTTAESIRWNYRVRSVKGVGDKPNVVEAISYPFAKNGKGNGVRFTPLQVEAVRSGLSPGLTMVVGPPGTGKTDTAVQIIACLYHSFPTQRTVVIAHSNAALNDIFQKVMARGDIQERYLVRLGAGERDLETDSTHDFTKLGRVAYSLERRGVLLEKVQLLAESLGVSSRAERGPDGSPAYTCESAGYFNQHQLQTRIRKFKKHSQELTDDDDVAALFPFAVFFEMGERLTNAQAKSYFEQLNDLFSELEEYRPFELLRSQRQRSDYLIMKQARIVAMTCTHAAIARSHLIKLGFEYDNIVVEEAGQMLEIEAFVPLLLQRGEADGKSAGSTRLKRVCLMGDHNQLPPVIQNMTFAKYSSLDQSLFTRLIRLGVPYIQLDKQGRARAEIASLYSWRYGNLGNLDYVKTSEEFCLANPGFAYTFQLINVENYEGKGESTPTAYFYQNVGEAEYVVALFQYMVLIGYAPHKISILTTYNGQKELINDIISHRCGEGTPLDGVRPKAISTVDQYQGQQNDVILLSLVRTEAVGHLRDVRRLIVAVSRARLGLYIFCRQELFCECHELKPTLDQFQGQPNKLQLVMGENYPSKRQASEVVSNDQLYEVDDVGHMGSIVHKMQEDWITSQSNS